MNEILPQIIRNKVFMATILAWAIGQTIKVSLGIFRLRKFDFRWFKDTGGMPSTHSTGVSCLAASTGIHCGFDSVNFAVAAAFALIVMFDAQAVRRSTGSQARILNKIMDDIYWQGRIEERRLRELIGHTPVEVIAGLLLGITVAFFTR